MIIPPEKLTVAVLRNLVEAYINREGTDYGAVELSLEEKVNKLMPQVIKGEVLIVFDEESESVNLMPKEEAMNMGAA